MTGDLDALRTEVAYQQSIPPWCKIKMAINCHELMSGIVQMRGRHECLMCQFHDREAGKHPAERMG